VRQGREPARHLLHSERETVRIVAHLGRGCGGAVAQGGDLVGQRDPEVDLGGDLLGSRTRLHGAAERPQQERLRRVV